MSINDVNKQELIDSLRSERVQAGNNTYIAEALVFAQSKLLQDRFGVHKTIILISDGEASSIENSLIVVQNIKEMGMMICTVFINKSLDYHNSYNNGDGKDLRVYLEFMQELSSNDCTTITTYDKLSKTLKDLGLCL